MKHYDVKISLSREEVLPDVFDWLFDQGLFHTKHYSYTKPDYFKDDWDFTFQFVSSKDATLFALRWS